MENYILIGIIVSSIAFIVICFVRRRPDMLMNFALRAVAGTAGIYLLNFVLSRTSSEIHVGVNLGTVSTGGLLGLPGILLLYGLAIYYSYRA